MPAFATPPRQVEAATDAATVADRPQHRAGAGRWPRHRPRRTRRSRCLQGLHRTTTGRRVVGRNRTRCANAWLHSRDRWPGRLRVQGWTDHMERFIAAADVVVGKPGGLTVAEVLACGRPSVRHAVVARPGVLQRPLPRARRRRPVHLAEDGTGARVDGAAGRPGTSSAAMQKRAWTAGRRDGAARVAATALQLARPQHGPGPPFRAGAAEWIPMIFALATATHRPARRGACPRQLGTCRQLLSRTLRTAPDRAAAVPRARATSRCRVPALRRHAAGTRRLDRASAFQQCAGRQSAGEQSPAGRRAVRAPVA